jgi:hypothetical protein
MSTKKPLWLHALEIVFTIVVTCLFLLTSKWISAAWEVDFNTTAITYLVWWQVSHYYDKLGTEVFMEAKENDDDQ